LPDNTKFALQLLDFAGATMKEVGDLRGVLIFAFGLAIIGFHFLVPNYFKGAAIICGAVLLASCELRGRYAFAAIILVIVAMAAAITYLMVFWRTGDVTWEIWALAGVIIAAGLPLIWSQWRSSRAAVGDAHNRDKTAETFPDKSINGQ
jgi:hypothetical protein